MTVFLPMFRRICIGFAVIAVCGCLASCKKKEEAPAPQSAPAPEAAAPAAGQGSETEEADAPASPAPSGVTSAEREQGQGAPVAKRKIILNHEITLEVKSVAASLEALKQLAESNGGYAFNSTRSGGDSGPSAGHAGIRVPSGRANGVMKGIRGMGRVESESSTAEDITEEYVDLEARLRNAKSSETRLLDLYDKAGKLSDVLAVEKELTRVRGDIESFEATKKNWDILTAMVTIEVSLHEPSGGFPSGHRFWNTIKGAFGKSIEVIADSLRALIVFIAGVLPWLAVFGPIGYLVVKWRRKKRKEKNDSVEKGETRQGEAGEIRDEGK